MMAAKRTPEPGVYPFFVLIDGRPAFYVVGWDGKRSEVRVVGEHETEQQVVDELADELWVTRPRHLRGAEEASHRPILRLL